MGILLCLITGISFYGGYILSKIIKKPKIVSVISVSLAFVVLLNLIFLDIIPDIFVFLISSFNYKNLIFSLLIIILGLLGLLYLDKFIPTHHHDHREVKDNLKEHNKHLEHISKISFLALIIHNILECMVLYLLAKESLAKGFLMTLAICLHNIPLGLQIGTGIKENKYTYLFLLTLSGLVGGILCLVLGSLPTLFEHYLLCFTFGMLLYLLLFELTPEIYHNLKNKYSLYGIIMGVIVIIIINSIASIL